ncbi:MAG: FKBP-type peptidyl-prolyl cis-trans isomerase [Bacteroidota bacterium]|nr:FKBP-type peptidyl-prolyl cis-trans isomerase [Bacteroidota bacterium]
MANRLFSLLLFLALVVTGCASESVEQPAADAAEEPQSEYLEDLIITDLAEGDGNMISAGQTAVAHYTLWLRDVTQEGEKGEMIQTSKDRGTPIPFQIGVGRVIPGWDQGVPGMKIGGTRELRVPYALAYGERGMPGGIPGKADLIFEIELVDIQ